MNIFAFIESIVSLTSSFEWRQPLWLLLIFQPLLLWVILRWKEKKISNNFADKHLLPWLKVEQEKSFLETLFSKNIAYWFTIPLLAIAMAGPRTALETSNSMQTSTLDIMLVIDVSASMKANDIQPSRLQRVTQELYELLTIIRRDIRIGSIVYAARPHLFIPFTNDHNALRFYLKDLNKLLLPTAGSDAANALIMAEDYLQNQNSHSNNSNTAKAILWITDGDFAENASVKKIDAVLKNIQGENISVHILGVGSIEGAAIPLRQGGWLQHNGQGVVSKSNFKILEHFSKLSDGRFSQVSDNESDWGILYRNGLLKKSSTNNRKTQTEDKPPQWHEYFQWFLFPGLLLLLISLVPLSWNKKDKAQVSKALFNLLFISGLISILFLPYSKSFAESHFSTDIHKAIKAYQKEEYALATAGFISSILGADTNQERAIAMHNLGNNYFQQGDYQNAAQLFEDALRYRPEQKQSQHNLKLSQELNALLKRRRRRGLAGNNNQGIGQRERTNPNQLATSLDNIRPKKTEPILPELPKDKLNSLVSKGLAHLKMLDEQNTKEQQKQQQKVEQARISLLRNQDDSLQMWKRLFEIEEGFPAKLKQAKPVQGLRPW